MRNNSIDVGIVTALGIERDAILSHLDSYNVVQEDLEPTYYRGRVNISGSNEYYTIVLVGLLKMGNNEAAVATTQLLRRWQPAHLMMVGIAGGVRSKVALGDVVVADFCHYYEIAKLTPEGDQRRSEQFPCDRLLYDRAYNYKGSKWKEQIGLPRPGSVQLENSLPKVHFAPIGSGDKVIADTQTLPRLLQECPKLLAVAMEGAGVAGAARKHTHPPRFIEIRGISDFADDQKDDNWHAYAANAAAAFTIGLLRSRPIKPLAAVKPVQTYENQSPIRNPNDDLRSERDVNYIRLRDLLKSERWQEADKETLAVMLRAVGIEKGFLDDNHIKDFPCTDLRTIDNLWVKYSKNRFGFSVQKLLWEGVDKDYERFGNLVGWRKNCEWIGLRYVIYDTNAPPGHLPSWGGVTEFGRKGNVWFGWGQDISSLTSLLVKYL
jgi:nucleoside phosphorylase